MTTELAGLEEQRDVLLTSLRDLEQERATGEIGDADYALLKDDYTARAAAVLREIEACRATRTRRRARPTATRAADRRAANRRTPGDRTADARTAGARTAGARTAGARPAGARTPGARASGRRDARPAGGGGTGARRAAGGATVPARTDGRAAGGPTTGRRAAGGQSAAGRATGRRASAGRVVRDRSAGRRRSLAITLGAAFAIVALTGGSVALFATGRNPGAPVTGSVPDGSSSSASDRVDEALELETDGRAVDALKLYDEILQDEPGNAEALAYRGWLLKRAGLPERALESLDQAVAADPTFADAHFFRGMVLYQDNDDPAGAVAEFEAFLANDPPPEFVDAVRQVLAQAQDAVAAKAAGAPVPTPEAPSDPAPAAPAG